MTRHDDNFCKEKKRKKEKERIFMPLSIFHFNGILMMMIKINVKQFLFHM